MSMVRRAGWTGWWLHTETGLVPDPKGPEPHRIERRQPPTVATPPAALIEYPPCTRNTEHGNRFRQRNAQGWMICTACRRDASVRSRARVA